MEWYLRNGLIAKEGWEERIAALRTERPRGKWMQLFERAVLQRIQQPVGILFSGGVDSTLIAFVLHKHNIPFTCYTIGFQDEGTKEPEDIVEARRVAQHFGWKHRDAVLSIGELEPVIRKTAAILDDVANPVTVGVGAVVVAAAELAAKDGVHVLFGGLGSEEIFAGYERHSQAGDVAEECWRGLLHMYERDLIRDFRIAAALGIAVPTPFMDWEVLAAGLPLGPKIKDGIKKYVLRALAEEYGLPHEFAFRPKRAAQYGSRVDSALERLAKRKGFSKKEYVESLINGL